VPEATTPIGSPTAAATPPVALSIAGSDSGGGAGVQADLKTFAALRVHGTCAITAVTAQNTREVRGVEVLQPARVRQQIETVLDDFEVRAVKTGMLGRPEVVGEVAALAATGRLPNLVVDPVLVSSTGHRLMEQGGIEAYLELLLPHACVVTPNLREAAILGGTTVGALEPLAARIAVAERLCAAGARYAVVKGGHLSDSADDVVAGPEGVSVLPGVRVTTGNDHGTGCSLSAAVAAGLARDVPVAEAIADAKAFVARALTGSAAWRLGGGHGPLDHFGWSRGP
jgi:hydroxymethylpyrimidine/phosphomethylpyrimidine kinase